MRDVISKYPNIADEVRRELAVAFDIMKTADEDIQDAEVISDTENKVTEVVAHKGVNDV